MDIEKVVENIQRICKDRGTNPTEAGKKSGAGKDLVSLMKRRGSFPSIEKMSLLAAYLGVTTSELLGEEKEPAPVSDLSLAGLTELCRIYRTLNAEGQEKLLDYAADLDASGRYIKASSFQLGKKKDC